MAAWIAVLPLLSAAVPVPLSCCLASILLLPPSLCHILLIDTRLLPLVLTQFDTLWLGGNVTLAFICLGWRGVLWEAEVTVFLVCIFLFTSTAMVVIDAVHVNAHYRLCMAILSTAMCFVSALSLAAAPAAHMNTKVMLVFNISVASVIRGRLFTLGIYSIRLRICIQSGKYVYPDLMKRFDHKYLTYRPACSAMEAFPLSPAAHYEPRLYKLYANVSKADCGLCCVIGTLSTCGCAPTSTWCFTSRCHERCSSKTA